jgi:hypothetical protein
MIKTRYLAQSSCGTGNRRAHYNKKRAFPVAAKWESGIVILEL